MRARLKSGSLGAAEGEMVCILTRGDVLTKEYVDQWLHLSKASGEYQRIVSRWLN